MISTLCVIFAAIVMYRTIDLVWMLNIRQFSGHPWRFVALSVHCALVGAGAVAVALGAEVGGPMLLAGITLMVVADRRRHERRRA